MELPANLLPADFSNGLLQRILPLLTQERLGALLQAWQALKQRLGMEHEGIYEVLEYDSVLDLKDATGATAVLERRQKVRFLQDNVIAYEDQVWGEGDPFAGYECSPGVPVDSYCDGYKTKVLISLRETKQRGDITEFRFRRTIANGFTEANEWLQTEISHRTRHLRLSVIFPSDRPCQHAVMVERNRNRTTRLGPSHSSQLTDGRQVLTWERRHPCINEFYTLKWLW